jgi:dipeptidyl aminopeptidase/acylaminoacyl peptidase
MFGEQQFQASPWSHPQRYIENSVMYKLNQVKTPVMIVHGLEDHRVRPEESLIVYRGLAQLGKQALLLQYRNGGHNYNRWPEPARLDFYTRFVQWMDDYVGGTAVILSPNPSDPSRMGIERD